MDTHTSTCYSGYVTELPFQTVNELIMSFTRFRGRGRWPPSVPGSGTCRTRREHPCDGFRKSLQRRGWTLRPDSPGPTPPALSVNMAFFDGRDECSKYPNFLLSCGRVPSGL